MILRDEEIFARSMIDRALISPTPGTLLSNSKIRIRRTGIRGSRITEKTEISPMAIAAFISARTFRASVAFATARLRASGVRTGG